MNTKPEALRLADALVADAVSPIDLKAAAELRRLHSVNAELLKSLEWIANRCPDDMLILPLNPIHQEASYDAGACSRAAIAKAQE